MMMIRIHLRSSLNRLLMAGAIACLTATGFAGVAAAAQDRQTPKSWDWEIKDGRKVPKGNVTTNPDGSRREVIRQGACTTVKEWSATGEYRETRECNPKAD
jgi:hypothetical protein